MKTNLIIAAVACLSLAACQQQTSEAPKGEKTSENMSAPAEQAEQTALNAEESQNQAEQLTAPTASYYDNNQNQSLAEQANPAIDTQQQTAQTQTDTQEND